MSQVMLSPHECANPHCTSHAIIEGNQDIGGIAHRLHKSKWYTGYICRQCASMSTAVSSSYTSRNTRFMLQAQIAERHLEAAEKHKNKEIAWKPPKTKHGPMPGWKEIQKRENSQAKNEFSWLHKWINEPKLQKVFADHSELQSFALHYGYGKSHIKDIIEHKKTLDEEMT